MPHELGIRGVTEFCSERWMPLPNSPTVCDAPLPAPEAGHFFVPRMIENAVADDSLAANYNWSVAWLCIFLPLSLIAAKQHF